MRADNSKRHVIDAARRRSQATQQRAVAALRRMDNAGTPVTFESVANEAGVSAILALHPHQTYAVRIRTPPGTTQLHRQRAEPGDRRFLTRFLGPHCGFEAANERIGELQSDNRRLRGALGEALRSQPCRRHRWPHAD